MVSDKLAQAFLRETGAGTDLILPDVGFLRKYYDYAAPLTEAPEIYHLFVGFALMAAACSRRVYLPFGAQKIFPNLWIILIAPSSRFKKSTALSIGSRIINASSLDVTYPNEFSREAMMGILENRPQGLFIWSELGGVLRNFDTSYMRGTKEMLTEMFDCPPEYKRVLQNKEIVIKDPCISIMSASTVEWLNGAIKEHDVMGGFLPRFVFVPADRPSKLLPIPPMPDPEQQAELVRLLEGVAQPEGVSKLSQDAEGIYDSWYRDNYRQMEKDTDSEILAPFYSRLGSYLLKFAMLYELSSTGSLTVSIESMHSACMLVDQLKAKIKHLLETDLLLTPEGELVKKVLAIVSQHPGISRSELLRKSRAYSRHLELAVQSLAERGELWSQSEGGKETRYYSNRPNEDKNDADM